MNFYHNDWTDRQLEVLEKKIRKVYAQADKEIQKKATRYFKKFARRYEQEFEAYQQGAYTKQEFQMWVQSQIGRGERWIALREEMAKRVTDANVTAAAYVNDTTPQIYSLNYNYEAYLIESVHSNASFTLINEQAARNLMFEQQILPLNVNIKKDEKWNMRKLENALLQGILQGDSMDNIAKRFRRVSDMNYSSAIRNARTAYTGAQNGGRMRSFESAAAMGIKLRKRWVATKDMRTRLSHRQLDGEIVPYDEEFSNGLMYPGDMSSDQPAELYNCRCTMVSEDAVVAKPHMTYREWERRHGDSN